MSIYWDQKMYNGFEYDIGEELYAIFNSDNESRWVCKVKILAMYPMWQDLDNIEDKGNSTTCFSYYVVILHYEELEELHYEHDKTMCLRGIDLFRSLDQAMNKAYRMIDKGISQHKK
jgi:hypothetical protein